MASSPSGLFQTLHHSYSDVILQKSNSIDTAFLTPPITPRSEKDVPFKPDDTDITSLSMKRKHEDGHCRPSHCRAAGACASTDRVVTRGETSPIFDETTLAHSKSMPALHTWPDMSPLKRGSATSKGIRCRSVQKRSRRWTLPNKASPTRGFTTLKPTFKHMITSGNTKASLSPAMITLRRATVKASHQTNITFFPPPTFSHARGSFMSCFSKSVMGENEDTTENLNFLAKQVGRNDHKRSVSMTLGTAQPTISVTAEALVTQIAPSGCFIDTNQLSRVRRSSAQHICGITPYEVIWDEDVPSSESESSSPSALASSQSHEISALTNRRRSVAVDKLELQFSKAVAQSRRGSYIETKDAIHDSRRASFQKLINNKFSRFFHDAALQNLPHSRKSKWSGPLKSTPTPMDAAVHLTFDDECWTPPSGENDFFPPLRSRTGTSEITWEQVAYQDPVTKNTDVMVEAVRPRIGSMVGASSHLRRRGTIARGAQQRRKSKEPTWRRLSSACTMPSMTAETAPLLHSSGWEERNS